MACMDHGDTGSVVLLAIFGQAMIALGVITPSQVPLRKYSISKFYQHLDSD